MKATFRTRVTGKVSGGYYITKWNNAVPVTVLANNADEAVKKATELMGKPTGHKYDEWTVTIDEVIEN